MEGRIRSGEQKWVLWGGKCKAGGSVRVQADLGERDTENYSEADLGWKQSHTITMSLKLKASSQGQAGVGSTTELFC